MANYRPPGKGELLQRAWRELRDRGTADLRRRAEEPLANQMTDFAKAAIVAPMGLRLGLGGSTGGMGYLVPRYTPDAVPQALRFEGGLGFFDAAPFPTPYTGFATQPREILGGAIAPYLAATKKDAKPMADADAYWDEAGKFYPLRAQAQKIIEDFKDKPAYHAWNSLRQIPMAMGYTGAAEGAMALGALQRLPAWLRGAEPAIPGSIRAAQQAERSAP